MSQVTKSFRPVRRPFTSAYTPSLEADRKSREGRRDAEEMRGQSARELCSSHCLECLPRLTLSRVHLIDEVKDIRDGGEGGLLEEGG